MRFVSMVNGWLLCGIAACFAVGSLHAASFNCAKAATPQEKAICSNKALSAQDSEMAVIYHRALAQVSASAKEQVRHDQQQWLSWLATICNAASSKDVSVLAQCMTAPYRDRIDFFKNAVSVKDGVLFYARSNYLAGKDDPQLLNSPSPQFRGWGTLAITWYVADDPAWSHWNASITETMTKTAADDKSDRPHSSDASNADSTEWASIPDISENLITTRMSFESMGHGAAHPTEYSWTLHWLRKTERELQATHVFRANTPWKEMLAMACWKGLKEQFADDDGSLFIKSAQDKDLLDVVKDPSSWSFTKDGLDISFPEYSVSPRVSPADDITVPWKDLESYLNAGFVPAQFVGK